MEKELKFPLQNKKIIVALIKKHQSSLYSDIDMATLAIGGSKSFGCPTNTNTGKFINPLTSAEQKGLEEITGDNFSIHSKTDNFYSTKEAKVILRKVGRKTETANLELDLSDPYQYILYKIAQVNPRVANSWKERNDKKSYEFVLIDGAEELEEELAFTEKRKEVMRYLIQNEDSKRKLYNLLRLYGVSNAQKQVDYKKASTAFIYNELDKATIRKTEVLKLHKLIKLGAKEIADKTFLEDVITLALVNKRGIEYTLSSGTKIGNSETEAIEWLNKDVNNSIRLQFQDAVDTYYNEI